MTNEVALVGEVRVGPRAHNLGEIFNFRERVFKVDHRQYHRERSQFTLVERLNLLVPVEQCVDGPEVRDEPGNPLQGSPTQHAHHLCGVKRSSVVGPHPQLELGGPLVMS